MKRTADFIAICVAVLILIASIATLPDSAVGSSGSILSGAQIDKNVLDVLHRSCRDCHSDATRYPWYSYVAPVSTFINNDVKRGRERLNLSRWQEYSLIRRQRALTGIANQVRDRAMPLPFYLWLHPSARLSDGDIEAVFNWTQRERLRLITSEK